MEMVNFNCPHCGNLLSAPAHMDGQTQSCPYCDRPVTLQVVSKKQIVNAMMAQMAGGFLAAFFDN
jgi:uncharacterized Zn finger protein (UPF0148 family)